MVGAGMDSGKYLNYSCPPFFVLALVSELAWVSSEYASVLRFLHSWLQETLPAYSSHLIAVVQPGLQLAWTYTNATVSFLSAHCACFGDSFTGFLQRVSKLEIRSQKTHPPQRQSSWEGARAESHCSRWSSAGPAPGGPAPALPLLEGAAAALPPQCAAAHVAPAACGPGPSPGVLPRSLQVRPLLQTLQVPGDPLLTLGIRVHHSFLLQPLWDEYYGFKLHPYEVTQPHT